MVMDNDNAPEKEEGEGDELAFDFWSDEGAMTLERGVGRGERLCPKPVVISQRILKCISRTKQANTEIQNYSTPTKKPCRPGRWN